MKTPSISWIAYGWICDMVFYPKGRHLLNKIFMIIESVLDFTITRDIIYPE